MNFFAIWRFAGEFLALGMGRKLVIILKMKNWPEHGLLNIRARRGIAPWLGNTRHASDEDITLAWYLLTETADVMGVSVNPADVDSGHGTGQGVMTGIKFSHHQSGTIKALSMQSSGG